MFGTGRWRQVARWGRDVVVVYLAIVFLLWLSGRLMLHVGPWILGLPATLLLLGGRVLVLWRYMSGYERALASMSKAQPADRWLAVAALIVCLVGLFLYGVTTLTMGGNGDPSWGVILFGVATCLYAWSVLFHRRRVLSRHDLEWTRRIVRERFEEVGDSTEHGQALQDLAARIDGQIDRWEP